MAICAARMLTSALTDGKSKSLPCGKRTSAKGGGVRPEEGADEKAGLKFSESKAAKATKCDRLMTEC